MNQYTTKIVGVECVNTEARKQIVSKIFWTMEATDGQNVEKFAVLRKDIPFDEQNSFTEFSSITQQQMMGWLLEALGQDHIQAVKEHLDEQLAQRKTPIVTMPELPWSK